VKKGTKEGTKKGTHPRLTERRENNNDDEAPPCSLAMQASQKSQQQ
jgi:hypothetical protein